MKPPKEKLVYVDLKNKEIDAVILWEDLNDATQSLENGDCLILGVYTFQKWVKVTKDVTIKVVDIS